MIPASARRLLAATLVVVAACSTETAPVEVTTLPPSSGTPPPTTFGPPSLRARFTDFAAAWDALQRGDAGSIDAVVHPESLALYGAERCVAQLTGGPVIGEDFEVRLAEFTFGLRRLTLDSAGVLARSPSQVRIQLPSGTELEFLIVEDLALVDCGDPLPEATPLLLASASQQDTAPGRPGDESFSEFVSQRPWYLQIVGGAPRGCAVRVTDGDSGATVFHLTVFEPAAVPVTATGPLALEATGECPIVVAISGEEALELPPTPLPPDPEDVWLAARLADDGGDSVVIVNSTSTDALLTGWALIDAGGFEFAFPFATRLRPSAQLFVHAGCGDGTADNAGAVFACHPEARFAPGAIRLVDVTGRETSVLVPSP